MLDIPEDSTLASRRHAAKGILMPRERDHPQHRSWVSVDERGHSMAWIYLACYLNGEANEFEYTTTVMRICELEFLAHSLVTQKSCKAKK